MTQPEWCILRTAGPRTLPLVTSLAKAGYRVWTPIATRRLPPRRDGKVRERQTAIAPTFVFAGEEHLITLAIEAKNPLSDHPSFSVFQRGNRGAIIGDHALAGLREAEAEALEQITGVRDEDARATARRARAEMMKTERAKRKLLRTQRVPMTPGTFVEVADTPALAGLVGEVIESRAKGAAHLIAFGGRMTIEIEAWRLLPHGVPAGQLVSLDRHSPVC